MDPLVFFAMTMQNVIVLKVTMETSAKTVGFFLKSSYYVFQTKSHFCFPECDCNPEGTGHCNKENGQCVCKVNESNGRTWYGDRCQYC